MLLKFRVRSEVAEDFILQIDADATNTFFQLHEALQEECKFDPSQLVTFFVADEEWDKGSEIKMFPDSPSQKSSPGERFMKSTRLTEFIKTEEDKLLYTYDISDDKSLYIELFEIKMEQTINTPTVKLRKGLAPSQKKLFNSEKYSSAENGTDSQHIFDDLGELEDLYNIYGEMSNTIL